MGARNENAQRSAAKGHGSEPGRARYIRRKNRQAGDLSGFFPYN